MLPSILERKFFAVESKFLCILSIVASYVKSKIMSSPVVKFQKIFMPTPGKVKGNSKGEGGFKSPIFKNKV